MTLQLTQVFLGLMVSSQLRTGSTKYISSQISFYVTFQTSQRLQISMIVMMTTLTLRGNETSSRVMPQKSTDIGNIILVETKIQYVQYPSQSFCWRMLVRVVVVRLKFFFLSFILSLLNSNFTSNSVVTSSLFLQLRKHHSFYNKNLVIFSFRYCALELNGIFYMLGTHTLVLMWGTHLLLMQAMQPFVDVGHAFLLIQGTVLVDARNIPWFVQGKHLGYYESHNLVMQDTHSWLI